MTTCLFPRNTRLPCFPHTDTQTESFSKRKQHLSPAAAGSSGGRFCLLSRSEDRFSLSHWFLLLPSSVKSQRLVQCPCPHEGRRLIRTTRSTGRCPHHPTRRTTTIQCPTTTCLRHTSDTALRCPSSRCRDGLMTKRPPSSGRRWCNIRSPHLHFHSSRLPSPEQEAKMQCILWSLFHSTCISLCPLTPRRPIRIILIWPWAYYSQIRYVWQWTGVT